MAYFELNDAVALGPMGFFKDEYWRDGYQYFSSCFDGGIRNCDNWLPSTDARDTKFLKDRMRVLGFNLRINHSASGIIDVDFFRGDYDTDFLDAIPRTQSKSEEWAVCMAAMDVWENGW